MTEQLIPPALGDATVQELREAVRGAVVTPTDTGYDDARQVWNGAIDRRPAVVVRCTGTADVLAALRFARSEALTVAVRGGGHNVAGFGTCDGGLVLDLSPMKGVHVDPVRRVVRAQGGLVWGELDHETQAFGLATTGGLVTTTGIAGFTLGGGIGWLMRKHGLAVDNLVSADVVTADGELVRANEESEPEALWGLRGGGGNLGVVTSFEYRLHPVGPMVYGGAAFYPAEQAGELLRFYRDWTRELPDELTTMAAFLTAPPEPFMPAELVGTPMVAIACCYVGSTADGEAAVAPLREFGVPAVDMLGPIPYTALQGMFDGSAPHGLHAYWKTQYLADLDGQAVDALTDAAGEMAGLSPFTAIHLHHLEGAVRQQPAGGSAFPHRDNRFVLNFVGGWLADEPAEPHISWVRAGWEAMRVHTTGTPYLNFMPDEGTDRVRAAYGEQTYARLVALKDRYDPTNLFRLNQNIPPST